MRELLAIVRVTCFHRSDADGHVERLAAELHAVRSGIYASLSLRHEPAIVLRPSWLQGELLTTPTHLLEMSHSIHERQGRYYCESRIGVSGRPPLSSLDTETLPETLRSTPIGRKH
jgi:hypothetical protein